MLLSLSGLLLEMLVISFLGDSYFEYMLGKTGGQFRSIAYFFCLSEERFTCLNFGQGSTCLVPLSTLVLSTCSSSKDFEQGRSLLDFAGFLLAVEALGLGDREGIGGGMSTSLSLTLLQAPLLILLSFKATCYLSWMTSVAIVSFFANPETKDYSDQSLGSFSLFLDFVCSFLSSQVSLVLTLTTLVGE